MLLPDDTFLQTVDSMANRVPFTIVREDREDGVLTAFCELAVASGYSNATVIEKPRVEHRLADGSLATPAMTRELGGIYAELLGAIKSEPDGDFILPNNLFARVHGVVVFFPDRALVYPESAANSITFIPHAHRFSKGPCSSKGAAKGKATKAATDARESVYGWTFHTGLLKDEAVAERKQQKAAAREQKRVEAVTRRFVDDLFAAVLKPYVEADKTAVQAEKMVARAACHERERQRLADLAAIEKEERAKRTALRKQARGEPTRA
jgi:hypothetical protein